MIDRGYLRYLYKRVVRRVTTWLVMPIWWLGQKLPISLTRPLAGACATVVGAIARADRRRAHEHLQMALPELGKEERDRIVREMFKGLAWSVAENLWVYGHGCLKSRRFVENDSFEAVDTLRRVIERGRGVIIASPHFGNFELLAIYLCSHFENGSTIAKRFSNEGLNDLVAAKRRSVGLKTFYQDSSVRHMLVQLKKGGPLGVVPDQDIDSRVGIFIDFFGRPAYTPTGPASLSQATGAAIVPSYLIRQPNGRYRVEFDAPIEPPETGDRARDVEIMTRAWSDAFERRIRQHPEQWVWTHRRWRTTPERLQERRLRRARRAAFESSS
ncbi:MAG: lysophospholipid acyltransferase family protein [Planctomycetota bacterium]